MCERRSDVTIVRRARRPSAEFPKATPYAVEDHHWGPRLQFDGIEHRENASRGRRPDVPSTGIARRRLDEGMTLPVFRTWTQPDSASPPLNALQHRQSTRQLFRKPMLIFMRIRRGDRIGVVGAGTHTPDTHRGTGLNRTIGEIVKSATENRIAQDDRRSAGERDRFQFPVGEKRKRSPVS